MRTKLRRSLTPLTLLVVGLVSTCIACSESPTQPGDADREIIYVYTPDGWTTSRHIWAMSADGSGSVQLDTVPGGNVRDPAWSPDREQIAFTQGHYSLASAPVFVMRRDGSGLRRVASGSFGSPTWFPDARRLLVVHRPESGGVRLATIELSTSAVSILPGTYSSATGRAALTPDGTRITYECFEGICEVSAAGGTSRVLIARAKAPSYSPDGSALAYLQLSGATGTEPAGIMVMSVASGATRVVHAALTEEASISWSPDGAQIVYPGRDYGTPETRAVPWAFGDLYVVPVDGGTPHKLTSVTGDQMMGWPDWSSRP